LSVAFCWLRASRCFLLFAVPAPDWAVDAATLPLKVAISNGVTRLLYAGGFPIAQDGVMITIGPYEVLVRDACSGMNSILALSAIGVFYAYVLRRDQPLRAVLLLLATVPIAVAANFVRVLTLVLIAYYCGIDVMEGALHGLTGVVLFLVALALFVGFDWLLGLVGRRPSLSRFESTSPPRPISPAAPK
jgi:exosortase